MTNLPPALPKAQTSQSGLLTFREAEQMLRDDPGLGDTSRRDLISALHSVAEWLGADMTTLHCSIPDLNDRLFQHHPAVFGVSVSTFKSVCSRLRAALRLVANHAPLERGEAMLSEVWRAFLGNATDKWVRVGLRGFARWCDAQGLSPQAVRDAHFVIFLAEDRASRLASGGRRSAQTVARAWNKLRLSGAAGEGLVELVAPRKREPYTKPFDWYLPSFAEDIEAYRQSIELAGALGLDQAPHGRSAVRRPGPLYTLAAKGRRLPRRRLRPASVSSRLFDLRMAAAALMACGVAREELRSLGDLVTPLDRVADVLEHYAAHGLGCGSLRAIATSLRMVAEHHVGLPSGEIDILRGWIAEVSEPPRKGMTLKNRQRLAKLLEPATLIRFLNLPALVLREASLLREGGRAALMLRRNGMIADVLVACPIRLGNLCRLRIDEHLIRGKGGRVTHAVIPGSQTKNGEDLLWPLRKDTARRLERYLKEVRPLLAEAGNPYVFPGKAGKPISADGARSAFQRTVEQYAGVVVNPHLVRHLAVHLLLTARPGQYETASRLLGHRSTATTRNAYLGLETDGCVALYEQAVLDAKRYGAPTPPGAPPRSGRRGRRGS